MAQGVTFPIKFVKEGNGVEVAARDMTELEAAVTKVNRKFKEFGESVSQKWSGIITGISSLNQVVGTLNDHIQKVANSFNSFDQSMRAVNTMAGLNEEQFGQMKDSISELGKVIPKTREELADGLYQVISNGVPEDNWLSFLEASAKASVGGIADLGQTVTVTSTIIKNYGLSWEKAADIQDKIQMTAKNGVTSFEQLAAALPRVTGSAATLGVSIDELMATFATLTGVSGNTAEVSTQLSAIFTALIKPSSEAAKMAEEMGIKFDASVIQAAGGMDQFLSQLDECVKEYSASSGVLETEVYGRLFGSAEAVRALIPITGNLAEKYSQNVAAMADATGTIDEACGQMSQTGEAQSIMWRNNLAAMTDWLGGLLSSKAPMTEFITSAGQSVTSIMAIGTALKALMATEQAQLIITKTITLATKAWSVVQMALNAIMSANPIAIIVLAIAALVAGIVAAYQKCEKFRMVCDVLWAAIKKVAQIVWDWLVKSFKDAVAGVITIWDWIKKLAGILWDSLVKAFNICKDAIVDFWNNADGLRRVLNAVWEVIKTGAKLIWDNLVAAFEKVSGAIKKAWNWLKKFVGWGKDDNKDSVDALEDEADAAKKTGEAYEELNKKKGSIKVEGGAAKTPAKSGGKASAPKGSIAAIDARIQSLRTELSLAINSESRAKVQSQLDDLEAQKRIIELETRLKMDGFDSIRDAFDVPKLEPIDITVKGLPSLITTNAELKKTDTAEKKLDTTQKKVARDGSRLNEVMDATGQLAGNTGEAIRKLTKDDNNAAAAWIDYGAAVAQSCAQMVTSLMSLIPAKQAEEQQSKKNTTANVAEASSGYFSAHAEIPFVGIVLALAAVAGMIATIMSLPKFAAGGIAYGPTMGLFGEYPGAANNPEVVAPLSKLKSLLNTDSVTGGRVEFEIKGRRLVGVLAKESNVMARR